MKFTETLFTFPIIVYNTKDIMKDLTQEESTGVSVDSSYAIAKTRIPVEEILDGMYHEGFAKDDSIDHIMTNGFPCTMLYTKSFGNFLCSWGLDKFEKKFNEHLDKLDAEVDQEKVHNIAKD